LTKSKTSTVDKKINKYKFINPITFVLRQNRIILVPKLLNLPKMHYRISVILFLLFQITAFSQSKTYQIGYLLDKSNIEIDSIVDKLSNEIRAVIGEDATVEFKSKNKLVNNFNTDLALVNYNELLLNDTDIIIAFGAVNNLVITEQKEFKKPTILFGSVSSELIDVLTNDCLSKLQ